MTFKIALSAGHHNTDGGSAVEASITGPLCHFYAEALRAAGCDVRVITPDDGLGYSAEGLQEVAAHVTTWASQGWTADLYLETHTQGLGDTMVRGAFAIYPDWGGDVDIAVRDSLGLSIVAAISNASGIPIWQGGVMSEKATGVGISGYRLGIFLRTASIAATTTRLIVEHGAHSNPQDLTILLNPANQQKIAQAGARTIVNYLKSNNPTSGILTTGPANPPNIPAGPKAFNPNPNNKDVGPGVLEVLTNEHMTAITNEDYYVPAGNKPGLTERSFTYASKDGVTLRVDAIQDQDASGNPLPTWKREIWQLVKEIK